MVWIAVIALLITALLPFVVRRTWARRALDVAIVISVGLLLVNPAWFDSEESLDLATPPSGGGDIEWDASAGSIVSPAQIPYRDNRKGVFVSGAGMPLASWMENPRMTPIAQAAVADGASWTWPATAVVGEPVVIEGPATGPVRLSLEGAPAFTEAAPTDGRVRFRFVPRITGRIRYQVSGPDLQESVAIFVQPRPPLRFAMEFSRPGFESNGLKRYLAAIGADGIAAWTISPEITRTQTVNGGAAADNLAALDIWIGDTQQFERRRDALLAAADNGLGVLILVDALPENPLPLSISERPGTDGTPELWLSDRRARWVHHEYRDRFGYRKVGNGAVGVSLLDATFQTITSSGMGAYAELWSDLLEPLLRAFPASIRHQSDDALPLVRTAVMSCSPGPRHDIAVSPQPLLMLNAGQHLGLSCTRWWPKAGGWHTVTINDATRPIYIYSRDAWQVRVHDHRRRHTAAASVLLQEASIIDEGRQRRPSIWLFLLSFFWFTSWFLGSRAREANL